jgi:hypothetical protein
MKLLKSWLPHVFGQLLLDFSMRTAMGFSVWNMRVAMRRSTRQKGTTYIYPFGLYAFSSDKTGEGKVKAVEIVGDNATLSRNSTTSGIVFSKDEGSDLNDWVSGFIKWPMYPGRASITDRQEELMVSISGNKSSASATAEDSFPSFPLTRILNMDALISFATRNQKSSQSDGNPALSRLSAGSTANDDIGFTTGSQGNLTTTVLLDDVNAWDKWVRGLQQNFGDLRALDQESGLALGRSGSSMLRQATARIESLVMEASAAISPKTFQTIVRQASEAIQNQTGANKNDLVDAAKQMARERGLDVSEAAARALETTVFAANLVAVADGVLRKGYVAGDQIPASEKEFLKGIAPVKNSRSLFADFEFAVEINVLSAEVSKDAEMGALAGAVYELTVQRCHAIGYTIVARGVTENVEWMVTDSIANATSFGRTSEVPFLLRTITIKGFDAGDDKVDREELLNNICSALPEKVDVGDGVLLHSGLRKLARAIYKDIQQYIDWTSTNHRIALNGHSVGGSLSLLVLLEMTLDRGVDFVLEKVQRVYTFGSPPVAAMYNSPTPSQREPEHHRSCAILRAFGLPSTIVSAYAQPWDPIVRLFSSDDPLYPLVGDIGADGVTPYASGPPRTLRPILRAIVESWDGWPRFRENFKESSSQNYTTAGVPHILLPAPTRYLVDRFVSVNIAVPSTESIVRLAPGQLHAALEAVFPLDVFEISFLPQGLRGFVHHFYPAYDEPVVAYVKRLERRAKGIPEPTVRPNQWF